MISKELLSEVLDTSIESIDSIKVFDFHEITYRRDGTDRYINIHELAHKCKEWAKDGCINVSSSVHNKSKNVRVYVVLLEYPNSSERFTADTEPEAIFKACEWILKETK